MKLLKYLLKYGRVSIFMDEDNIYIVSLMIMYDGEVFFIEAGEKSLIKAIKGTYELLTEKLSDFDDRFLGLHF